MRIFRNRSRGDDMSSTVPLSVCFGAALPRFSRCRTIPRRCGGVLVRCAAEDLGVGLGKAVWQGWPGWGLGREWSMVGLERHVLSLESTPRREIGNNWYGDCRKGTEDWMVRGCDHHKRVCSFNYEAHDLCSNRVGEVWQEKGRNDMVECALLQSLRMPNDNPPIHTTRCTRLVSSPPIIVKRLTYC